MVRGFSAVEVLLASAVLSLLVTSMVGATIFGEEGTALSGSRNRATLLSDEGLEAVRNIRDAGFAGLTSGTFVLTTTGNQWNLSGSSDTTDIFTRSVTITTATESANRKNIAPVVTWQQNLQRTGNTTLNSRLTNWRRVFGNWASPSVQASVNIGGNQNGNKVARQGNYAYVVRNAGTPDFAVIDVSNSASPTLVGSLTLSGNPTNIAVSGNYAYVSATDNAGELKIVDISTPTAPSLVGTFNAPGNADGNGVSVSGSTVYLTRSTNSNNFVVVNVATPTAPTQVGILSTGGPLFESVVIGSNVFVSTGDGSAELKAISVATPSAPTVIGGLNLAGGFSAESITGYSSPDTVFVGQTNGPGTVSLINVASPTAPTLLSSFSAGDAVNDVALGLGSGYLFLAKNNGAAEFSVWDVADTASPTAVGNSNLSATQNGVVFDEDRDRAYLVGNDNASEFSLIKPL